MGTVILVVLGLVVWFGLGVAVGLVIVRGIRRRDTQVPSRESRPDDSGVTANP